MSHNIRESLGVTNEEAVKIARGNLELHYIHLLEFFKFPQFSINNIDRYVEIRGKEYLEAGLREGKGIILVHLHFGTMQIPLIALGLKGYPMNQIGQREPENKKLSFIHRKVALRLRLKIEDTIPANLINIGMTISLRPAFRCLKQNEILMITGDGRGGINPIGDNYILVNFLGRKAYFPPGPIVLARKSGAKMLPLFCFRLSDKRYCVEIHPALSLDFGEDRQEDIRKNTQIYAEVLSKRIRDYPQYWMFWEEFSPGQMVFKE
jgi:lauroyl/myristoyl acyltransferase